MAAVVGVDWRGLRARAVEFVRNALARDAVRLGLWAPVALGAGAALYLGLTSEPAAWLAPLTGFVAGGAALVSARGRPAAIALALMALGFAVADLRASAVAAPVLTRDLRFAEIEGRLLAVEEAAKLRRLIIAVDRIEGLEASDTPARLRVSWRGPAFDAAPGDRVRLTGSLSPPPQPATPGGYDFARHLYFQRIGAVGFAFSAPEVLAEAAPPLRARIAGGIERFRLSLTRRIIAATGASDAGAIVAAVVTGKREAISEEAEAVFRDSGLTHLLSISGLHIGLATGIIFFTVRAGFALIEPVALNFPVKKWAAFAAIVSGGAYLAMSGLAWPAQRSFLMTAIVYLAILVDRRALSLRNVAIAAAVILLIAPEAVANPGFQMSFAAVTALIAFYEWATARADPHRSFTLAGRARRYALGIVATDIISSLATAPFSLFHFNRAANFGLLANSISIPLMGFWVMPVAILAMMVAPFGLDGPLWRAAAAGIDVMLALGRWTSELPGAVTVFPKWPDAVLPVFAISGLWICLMTGPWRLLGLAGAPLAFLLIALSRPPDVYVTASGENAAFVLYTEEKILAVFNARKDRFAARSFLENAGLDERKSAPQPMRRLGFCDNQGCAAPVRSAAVAVTDRREALDDDCARAALVIALFPVSRLERNACAAALIDRRDVWREGAHAARMTPDGARIESVRDRRGTRPWADY
ncbi:MAG: ComEC/Rec2 family competence protein [Parvularculaceae bacterium]|nr:ComEC/Rec2 family competence protein [Parvularculaceae bacterium]